MFKGLDDFFANRDAYIFEVEDNRVKRVENVVVEDVDGLVSSKSFHDLVNFLLQSLSRDLHYVDTVLYPELIWVCRLVTELGVSCWEHECCDSCNVEV